MKKVLLFLPALLVLAGVYAQEKTEPYLWPIKDAQTGAGIVCAPQGYIDTELNSDNLFITAPEGTVVVAPCDGTIGTVGLVYMASLVQQNSAGLGNGESFDISMGKISAQDFRAQDKKYCNGFLVIKAGNGDYIHISGLSGDGVFKSGQSVKKGEPIGKVSYSYRKIEEPSISITFSRNTKPVDPMSPFGIKSSFVAPGELKPVTSLTKEQAVEDFNLYIEILKEAFAGLYNVVTPEELSDYHSKVIAQINSFENDLTYWDFREIMSRAMAKIHDSHLSMRPPARESGYKGPNFQPKIIFGYLEGQLMCINAVREYERLLGKEILAVNGVAADSIRDFYYSITSGYDAAVESRKERNAATNGFGRFFRTNPSFDMIVEFADGEKLEIEGHDTRKGKPDWVNNMNAFMYRNLHRKGPRMKMFGDSTAYMGLTTFNLNEVQLEQVASFIDSVSSVPNLIIDLRSNGGGDGRVIKKIFSYIAGEPIRMAGYSKVNKKGNYNAFKYSNNYVAAEEILFPDFEPREGKDGFYSDHGKGNIIDPDSAVNYKGRVYVLVDENSASAATMFPGYLLRSHRGVVVGRETPTAYHFMNAGKFVEVSLPHSRIMVNIPLLEVVFDTVVNERVPYGRGVIPDYKVPLTYHELISHDTDAIVDYTLKLIENGEYISDENPFANAAESKKKVTEVAN